MIAIHNNKAFEYRDLGNGFAGYLPIPTVTDITPSIEWTGSKIPFDQWRQMLAFFRHSYLETKSETQAQFFHNPATGEWQIHAFPQEHGTGMVARDLPNHPDYAKQMEAVLAGGKFEKKGTAHHHCASGAFQSSVDHKDEKQLGLHVTIGNMDKDVFSVHARVSVLVPGTLENGIAVTAAAHAYYEADLTQWIDLPENLIPSHLPAVIREAAAKHYITECPAVGTQMPKVWMDNLIKVAPLVVSKTYYGKHQHSTAKPDRTMASLWNGDGYDTWMDEPAEPQTPITPDSKVLLDAVKAVRGIMEEEDVSICHLVGVMDCRDYLEISEMDFKERNLVELVAAALNESTDWLTWEDVREALLEGELEEAV